MSNRLQPAAIAIRPQHSPYNPILLEITPAADQDHTTVDLYKTRRHVPAHLLRLVLPVAALGCIACTPVGSADACMPVAEVLNAASGDVLAVLLLLAIPDSS